MPELPEVELLVRHLAPAVKQRVIRGVSVRRATVLAPTSPQRFKQVLTNARFTGLSRRGKYLLFTLEKGAAREPIQMLGHLGMTGRMYVDSADAPLPKHAAVIFDLDKNKFVFEDTRYFGRLTLDIEPVKRLGPEPFGPDFTLDGFAQALKRSVQAIKVRLLDQSLVAGVGNIYASEALFRAGISPRTAARRLTAAQVEKLWRAIPETLAEAIEAGGTVPLDYAGVGDRDGLYYFGRAPEAADRYAERLRVYDRAGEPCRKCRSAIRRFVQAARSTFYCPQCQRK